MADAVPTPATATSTTALAPAEPSTPVAAAPPSDATPTTPTPSAEPSVSTEPAKGPEATQEAKPQALFAVPADLKLAPEATTKFESFLRTKLSADGKVTLTSQEVLDHYAEQARDASARWQKHILDTDKANEDTCKARFTPAQLAASETAVGFLSSFDPTFRELAKRQLNDPAFVNAMRIIGERLSEDSLEVAGVPPPVVSRKSPAERMGYAKPKPN